MLPSAFRLRQNFCADGGQFYKVENTVVVMGLYFRAGASPFLPSCRLKYQILVLRPVDDFSAAFAIALSYFAFSLLEYSLSWRECGLIRLDSSHRVGPPHQILPNDISICIRRTRFLPTSSVIIQSSLRLRDTPGQYRSCSSGGFSVTSL
jgi:hypothetical protein